MIYTPDTREYLLATSPDITPNSYDERYAGGILLGAAVILDSIPPIKISAPLSVSDYGKSILHANSEAVRYGTAALLTTPLEIHDMAIGDFINQFRIDDMIALPSAIGLLRNAVVEGHRWRARTEAGLGSPFPLDEDGIVRAVNFIFGQTEGEA